MAPCHHPEDRASVLFPARDYITGERFEVASCGVCGLARTVPRPDDARLPDYYPTAYYGAPAARRFPAAVEWLQRRLYGARGPLNNTTREWRNEEFNALGATLETSLDTAARRAAWRRMLEIYDEADPPGTVLHQFAMFYVKRREVDWRPLPTEWMDFRPESLRTMRAAAR